MDKLSIKEQLMASINDLNEDQQRSLLDYLGRKKNIFRKRPDRKKCAIETDYTIGDKTFKGLIKNFSISGVYIKPKQTHFSGREISINFPIPDFSKPIGFFGKIVRSDLNGFAVDYNRNKELLVVL